MRPDGNAAQLLLATLRRPHTLVFAAQLYVMANLAYINVFFAPKIIVLALPSMPFEFYSLVSLAFTAGPALLSPPIATWADRGGAPRRFVVGWLSLFGGAALLLASAACMILSGPTTQPPQSLLLMPAAVALVYACDPNIWALHHSIQPAALMPTSIAVVNAIANSTGFIVPVAIGRLLDVNAGSLCPAAHACLAEYGVAIVPVCIVGLVISSCSTVAVTRLKMHLPQHGGKSELV